MNRRRFLAISAAALAAPSGACAETVWIGRALGAEARLSFDAPPDLARRAIAETTRLLRETEALFSLYDPASALSRLNRTGRLDAPPAPFLELMHQAHHVHRLTEGRFDPTIQPLWTALATGGDVARARAALGWHRVAFEAGSVRLAPGQALSVNGIAQGFATDRVTRALRRLGLTRVLAHVGEYAALGGPYTLGLADPEHGHLAARDLTDGAIATSSPGALLVGGQAHILDPSGAAPRWSTVSVEADTATLADGLSTALCLADLPTIRRLRPLFPAVRRITLVDTAGDIATL